MNTKSEQWTVGILLFNEVEVLDFTGPFEVFSITTPDGEDGPAPFVVKTVSQSDGTITARSGLRVLTDFDFANSPHFDIIIVPGGPGAREDEFGNTLLLNWIRKQAESSMITAAVCTGALLLANSGLLDDKKATTHWRSYDFLESQFPAVSLVRGVKYVDEGRIMTSGGISSGINLSLHIVEKLLGSEVASRTAKRMEFDFMPGRAE